MFESLHPVTVAVAIACVPVAAILLSAGVDYLAHRHQEPTPSRAVDRSSSAPLPAGSTTSRKALPAGAQPPANTRKP